VFTIKLELGSMDNVPGMMKSALGAQPSSRAPTTRRSRLKRTTARSITSFGVLKRVSIQRIARGSTRRYKIMLITAISEIKIVDCESFQ
jgi:hypothetical protein